MVMVIVEILMNIIIIIIMIGKFILKKLKRRELLELVVTVKKIGLG